jgi:hypothetical protein
LRRSENGHTCSEVINDEYKERADTTEEEDGQGQQNMRPLRDTSGNHPFIRSEYVPTLFQRNSAEARIPEVHVRRSKKE